VLGSASATLIRVVAVTSIVASSLLGCVRVHVNADDCAAKLAAVDSTSNHWITRHARNLRDHPSNPTLAKRFLIGTSKEISTAMDRNWYRPEAYRPATIEIQIDDAAVAYADQCNGNSVVSVSTGLLRGVLDTAISYTAGLYPMVKRERLHDLVFGQSPQGLIELAALATVAREYKKGVVWVLAHEQSHIWFDRCGDADEGRADRIGVEMVQEVFLRSCDLPTTEELVSEWIRERGTASVFQQTNSIGEIGERALGRSGAVVALEFYRMSGFEERGTRDPIPQRIAELNSGGKNLASQWFSAIDHYITGPMNNGSTAKFFIVPETGCPCFRTLNRF
jgi:hypothetical protein